MSLKWQPAETLPRKWWMTPSGEMIPLKRHEQHHEWAHEFVVEHYLEQQTEKGGAVTYLRDLGWVVVYRHHFTLVAEYEVKRGLNHKQLKTLIDYAIVMGLDLKDGIKNRLIPLTENSNIEKTRKYLYTNMNYRDFYKNNKRKPISENEQENLLRNLNLDEPAVDDGLPKREDGSLDISHDGRPIHLSKIIQIGSQFGKSADGEVSGFTNIGADRRSKGASQSKDGEDQENITASGHGSNSDLASKTVGDKVVNGGGQRQDGPNHGGAIAGTSKFGSEEAEGDNVLTLQEAKAKLRNMVKEALKEISFNKQSGRWERITENHDSAGFPTSVPGRPQYKVAGPQYRTVDDMLARTRQYEPEITEMHDEENEHAMQDRYTELATAQRNLSESELSEMRDLGVKLDKFDENEGEGDKKDQNDPIIRQEPGKRGGKPNIRGMRITVDDILGWIKSGMSHEQIISDFPELTNQDIDAAINHGKGQGGSVKESDVNMKMGPSYKVVQPRLNKTSEPDFFARKNEYDPEVSEYGVPTIEPDVEPETEPWREPETEPSPEPAPHEPNQPNEPQIPDPLQPERPGIAPRPRGEGVMEAGGGAVQHSSFRTAKDYPFGKNRHRNDIDESAKKKVDEVADNKWTILHDIAVHCKRRFPTINSNQLTQVIPILFKKDTGWDANPEQVKKIISQVESGEIKQ